MTSEPAGSVPPTTNHEPIRVPIDVIGDNEATPPQATPQRPQAWWYRRTVGRPTPGDLAVDSITAAAYLLAVPFLPAAVPGWVALPVAMYGIAAAFLGAYYALQQGVARASRAGRIAGYALVYGAAPIFSAGMWALVYRVAPGPVRLVATWMFDHRGVILPVAILAGLACWFRLECKAHGVTWAGLREALRRHRALERVRDALEREDRRHD